MPNKAIEFTISISKIHKQETVYPYSFWEVGIKSKDGSESITGHAGDTLMDVLEKLPNHIWKKYLHENEFEDWLTINHIINKIENEGENTTNI